MSTSTSIHSPPGSTWSLISFFDLRTTGLQFHLSTIGRKSDGIFGKTWSRFSIKPISFITPEARTAGADDSSSEGNPPFFTNFCNNRTAGSTGLSSSSTSTSSTACLAFAGGGAEDEDEDPEAAPDRASATRINFSVATKKTTELKPASSAGWGPKSFGPSCKGHWKFMTTTRGTLQPGCQPWPPAGIWISLGVTSSRRHPAVTMSIPTHL
mmetsp:Transcript_65560/g.145060  ORF Transcript_65560/g.145060 Transcript_65560/m.145060 type:complete len:211 (-) Transcript_65560:541-1173(-)